MRYHAAAENQYPAVGNWVIVKPQALMALGISKSSYYRWRHGQPDSGNRKRPWNQITPEEEDRILAIAREYTDLSSRQLSAWITDSACMPH